MSLVFGGEIGKTDWYTLYAGSLDDPSAFHPTIAIFADGPSGLGGHPAGLQSVRSGAALKLSRIMLRPSPPPAVSV